MNNISDILLFEFAPVSIGIILDFLMFIFRLKKKQDYAIIDNDATIIAVSVKHIYLSMDVTCW